VTQDNTYRDAQYTQHRVNRASNDAETTPLAGSRDPYALKSAGFLVAYAVW